jgi:hypothetical protein
MKLVLFDIDGTLVDCGGQARTAFADALLAVTGSTGGLETYDFSGKLDPCIVVDLLSGMGLSRDEVAAHLPEVQAAYLARLERTLLAERMRLLPGVALLLDELVAREDVVLALLTGNWERGARSFRASTSTATSRSAPSGTTRSTATTCLRWCGGARATAWAGTSWPARRSSWGTRCWTCRAPGPTASRAWLSPPGA